MLDGTHSTQRATVYPCADAALIAELKDSWICFFWLSATPWTKYFACQIDIRRRASGAGLPWRVDPGTGVDDDRGAPYVLSEVNQWGRS
jgi:hypothetical protein